MAALLFGKVVTNGLQVCIPVWPIESIDAIILIPHNLIIEAVDGVAFFTELEDKAGGELDNLVQAVSVKVFLKL